MITICDECGKPCEVVTVRTCEASDDYGDQVYVGDGSDCCGADFKEKEDDYVA